MSQINYNKDAEKTLDILSKGAFLTSEYAGEVNTMTIAWGAVGFMWNRPVFTALVRKSRHTHELIEKSGAFSITVPYEDMKKALMFCGTESGKNVNKFDKLGLKYTASQKILTPIIDCKGIHYECMVLYKTDMSADNLDSLVKDKFYSDNDFHTYYFAEIVNTVII